MSFLFRQMMMLAFSVTAISISAAAAVPAHTVSRKVGVLGKIAYGANVHVIKGKDAVEMIKALAIQNGEDAGDVQIQIDLPEKEIAFGDMIGWGTLQPSVAVKLFLSQQHTDKEGQETSLSDKQVALATALIEELAKMGMKFGYTPGSSGYCGISFMGLLIVDEKNSVIYELPLTDSGSC